MSMAVDLTSEALRLIDAVIGPRTDEQLMREKLDREVAHMRSLGLLPLEMGGIATKGCTKRGCSGTMYRSRDADGPMWICNKCGKVD
jgi:hypothetical protein